MRDIKYGVPIHLQLLSIVVGPNREVSEVSATHVSIAIIVIVLPLIISIEHLSLILEKRMGYKSVNRFDLGWNDLPLIVPLLVLSLIMIINCVLKKHTGNQTTSKTL